jgi:hypothetical protein
MNFVCRLLGPFGALICDGTADSGALGAFSWLFFQVVTGQRRNDPEVDTNNEKKKKQNSQRDDPMECGFLFIYSRGEERERDREERASGRSLGRRLIDPVGWTGRRPDASRRRQKGTWATDRTTTNGWSSSAFFQHTTRAHWPPAPWHQTNDSSPSSR